METELHPYYQILGDTEIYQHGDGYERTLVIANWHVDNPRRLMQVSMRIDRLPGSSFAYGSVWTANGWVEVLRPHNVTFWSDMPGFTRWRQDNAEAKTRGLAYKIAEQMREISSYSDI